MRKRRFLQLEGSLNRTSRHIFNAGRVLSAENEGKLRDARDRLDEVLSKLGGEPATDGVRAFSRQSLKPSVLRIAAKPASNEADVYIYGDIGGWFDGVSSGDFSKELSGLKVDTINAYLNSGGGIVFDGIAIYNALVAHPARVVMNITGGALSIASVIAMAGDEIRVGETAEIMIHKPWSFAAGDSNAMRQEADVLDELESGIIDIYEARTEIDRAQLQAWVNSETWFKGQAAIDAGFADALIPTKKKEKKQVNSSLLKLYRNTPQELLTENGNQPAIREFERLLRDGEAFSWKDSERIARLARRIFREPRDGASQSLRDEGRRITKSDINSIVGAMKRLAK